jgi:two-component system, cell cycle sensor histidine kinase and response regulator CckA
MGAAIGQVQSGQATNTLFRIVRPDGTTRWARSRAFPVSDSNRIVGVVEDITELRQVEQQAVQAQKMEAVARLAGGVAHDFNNLLTVIMGEADLVLSLEELPESIAESLSEVRKAGERASVLTRQLLAFSRKQLIEPDIYDVNEIVQDMEKMLRRLIGEDIVFATRLAGRELNVRVDRGQMEQVLANLAVNARDALPDGGMLSIETSRIHLDDEGGRTYEQLAAGDYIVLSVTDNGTGMSTEVLTRIFEPFFTTKGEGKGTGLGLATCYAIIKGAGGHIAAYSEVGVGTTMRVYIPAIEVATTKSRTSVKSALPRGNETVLLVEDDAAVRRVATRILQSLGYQVLEAAGGRDALVPLADPGVHVDLLLTDVVMPGMSGRTVAERALQLRPQLKILFASGYTDDMILQQRLLEEGARLVQKPLTPEGLARRVRDVLDAEK